MTTGASGLSVEQMLDLNRRFTQAGQQFATSRTTVNFSVMETWWAGPDAMRFRALWDGTLSPRLIRITEELFELANKITQEIQQQQQASAANGPTPTAITTPSLPQWLTTVKDVWSGIDAGLAGLGAAIKVIEGQLVRVAGYVRANGTAVASYFRWARGQADDLSRLLGQAGAFDDFAKVFSIVERGANAVTGLIGAVEQWNKDAGLELGERAARAAAVGAGRIATSLAIGWAAGEAGAAIGAGLGTFIAPGVGTAIGAGAGFVIGAGASLLVDAHLGEQLDSLAASAGSAVYDGLSTAADAIGSVAETGREVLDSVAETGANLISSGWKSVFG